MTRLARLLARLDAAVDRALLTEPDYSAAKRRT